jgi:hypothetical protein
MEGIAWNGNGETKLRIGSGGWGYVKSRVKPAPICRESTVREIDLSLLLLPGFTDRVVYSLNELLQAAQAKTKTQQG